MDYRATEQHSTYPLAGQSAVQDHRLGCSASESVVQAIGSKPQGALLHIAWAELWAVARVWPIQKEISSIIFARCAVPHSAATDSTEVEQYQSLSPVLFAFFCHLRLIFTRSHPSTRHRQNVHQLHHPLPWSHSSDQLPPCPPVVEHWTKSENIHIHKLAFVPMHLLSWYYHIHTKCNRLILFCCNCC